jgi:hypothetical protein
MRHSRPRAAAAVQVALGALVNHAAGWAQQVDLLPSAALSCLAPAAEVRGVPEYPFTPWKAGKGGSVKVELVFTTPTGRPEVLVQAHEGPDELLDAVREHVRAFRVPCLSAIDAPARLVFNFVFKPDDDRRVVWSRSADADETARRQMLACMRHPSGAKGPSYPRRALSSDVQGRVLIRLRFTAPDQPPQVETFARPSAKWLSSASQHWVSDMRMPCHTGGPIDATLTFVYLIGGAQYGFKPLDLLQLLRLTRGINAATLKIDTTRMGCPFDLRLDYRQPLLPNRVGEAEPVNPERQPLIDWMKTVELQLSERDLDAVFADTTTVTVPCLKLDLKPKEKS